jgi:N-methylhydantoinase B
MERRSPRRSSRARAACSVAKERTTIDPVTAEVVRSMLETICFEMATFVSRTATTPILNQSNERNATILDGHGRLAALSVGIPQFMLSSTLPVRFALDFLAGELYPGDVLVANDPYHGGGHLPDFNVFAPVFAGEELVLIASIQCHHGDTGGALAGGYNVFAKDIWSEGTRYPLLKIIEAGRERRDVVLTMRANNRLAGFIGDLRAQVGAAQLGARRLGEVIGSYGADTVRAAVDWTIDDAHRRFAAEIARWPDGRYEADVFVDADPAGNEDIHVHVAVTVDGDRLVVDFDGSDRRPEIQAWSTFGNTRGYTIAQLASLVDPSIPKNEGFFDCVDLRVPEGTCVNPTEGKPVSSGTHHPGVEVGDAVALAMAQILPDRCGATSIPAPGSRSSTTAARSTPGGSTRCETSTAGEPSPPRTATSSKPRPRSTKPCSRTCSGAATTSPTRVARASGAAAVALSSSKRSARPPRSTSTS